VLLLHFILYFKRKGAKLLVKHVTWLGSGAWHEMVRSYHSVHTGGNGKEFYGRGKKRYIKGRLWISHGLHLQINRIIIATGIQDLGRWCDSAESRVDASLGASLACLALGWNAKSWFSCFIDDAGFSGFSEVLLASELGMTSCVGCRQKSIIGIYESPIKKRRYQNWRRGDEFRSKILRER